MLALTIKKDEFAKGVGLTSAIAEKRSSMPILSNILLEAAGSELTLCATDMEITFQCAYPAEILSPGRLTVPAKKLNEVARLLNAADVDLREADNFSLGLAAGKFSTQMNGLSPADFPQIPSFDNIQYVDLDGPALAETIDKTIFSVAMEETRYNLSGIYVEKVEHEGRLSLRMVSTDGHRLNIANLYAPDLANLELLKGVLVSKKGMTELKRMAESCETLKIGMTQNSMVAKGASSVLVMRLLDGRFPDYNLVLPSNNDKILTVDRKELAEALKRISIMSSDDYKSVKFQMEAGRLTVSSMNPELGKAEESIDAEYAAEALEAGYNPRFFIEALSALNGEKVQISFFDASTPALLTSAEDPGYTGVIMSMKI